MKNEIHPYRTADGRELFAQSWLPESGPRRVIALVHGLGEHGGRYVQVAEFFGRSGYAMTAYDLRGHGRTEGARGHIPSWDRLLDDVELHIGETRKRFPGLPVFLYGHSLGGLLVLSCLLERKAAATADLCGVIATSPGLATAEPVAGGKLLMGKLMYRLAPGFTMDNGLVLSALSRDPEVLRKVQADPLYHRTISARLGLDFIMTGRRVRAYKGSVAKPLLLVQGTADAIVSPGSTIALAQNLTGDVTLKTWKGLFHETHNEPEREQVLSFTRDWMESRASGKA